MTIQIDPEFRDIIPPLTKPEYDQLEENIKREGCRERIITWNDYIIDGHNRYNICSDNDIEFETLEMNQFRDRHEVIDWMIQNQIGKRNLSGGTISYLRGLKLKREKERKLAEKKAELEREMMAAPVEPEVVQVDGEDVVAPEVVVEEKKSENKEMLTIIREHEEQIAEEVARMYSVSPATIKKDEKFTDAVHTIRENVGRDIHDKIFNKDLKLNTNEVVSISKMEREKQQELMSGEDEEILERLAEVKREKKELNQKKALIKLDQRAVELNGLVSEGRFVIESDDGEQVYLLYIAEDDQETLVEQFKGTGKVDPFLDGFMAALRFGGKSSGEFSEPSDSSEEE